MLGSRYIEASDMFPNTRYLIALKDARITYLKNKTKKQRIISNFCYIQLINVLCE